MSSITAVSSSHCIVIEWGSCIIRVGIAGESSPRFSFQYDRFHKLIGERGGEVKPNSDDLNVMNTLNGIFVVLLQTKSKDSKVVVIESLYGPRTLREMIFHHLFVTFQVQLISFQPDLGLPMMLQWSVLKGHDGMIVVDLGQTETRVMKMSCNRVVLSSLRVAAVGMIHCKAIFHALILTHWRRIYEDQMESSEVDNSNTFESQYCISRSYADVVFHHMAALGVCQPGWTEGVNGTESWTLPSSSEYTYKCISGNTEASIPRSTFVSALVLSGLLVLADDKCSWLPNFPDRCAYFDAALASGCCRDEMGGVVGAIQASVLACASDMNRPSRHATTPPDATEERITHAQTIMFVGGGSNIQGLASGICTLLNESHSPTTYVPMSTQQCVGVQPSERVWAGGSLWATIKSNQAKFVSNPTSSAKQKDLHSPGLGKPASGQEAVESGLYAVPDWMAIHTPASLSVKPSNTTMDGGRTDVVKGEVYHEAIPGDHVFFAGYGSITTK